MPPSRRRLLAGVGGFFAAGLAGCLGLNRSESGNVTPTDPVNVTLMEPDQSRETVGDVSAYYPTEGMGISTVSAWKDDGPSDETQTLAELEPAAHRDAILAITRKTYYPTAVTVDEDGLVGPTRVQYGDSVFEVEPAAGSRRPSVEFDQVLTLDPSLSAGELTLAVRNDGQNRYEVGHFGRPYFGILCTWDVGHHLLGNEYYGTNDNIVTGDGYAYPARTDEDTTSSDEGWHELSPGDAITETYVVPDGIDDGAVVYVEVPYRRTPEQDGASEESPQLQRVIWYVTIGT
jgi:hypothetical protein